MKITVFSNVTSCSSVEGYTLKMEAHLYLNQTAHRHIQEDSNPNEIRGFLFLLKVRLNR
jgi:hypothetical protein